MKKAAGETPAAGKLGTHTYVSPRRLHASRSSPSRAQPKGRGQKEGRNGKCRAALIDSQFRSVLVLYQISVTLSMLFAGAVPQLTALNAT
jgi:hypothetical protein